MALSTQPYKGARDFYPPDKRVQKYMFARLREVAERYGYEEYDAPILEPLEIYLAKTGEEIVNEQTYAFEDRGGRKVVVRPEMTPTVSRMVAAKRQELAYPLRWYSIPNLWRYERPQRGRLREHWQLNVDVFGLSGIEAEYEAICMVTDIFKAFGASPDMYEIKLNSRKLTDTAFRDHLGFDERQAHRLSKLIDRMHKMDRADFAAKIDEVCTPQQRESGAVEQVLDLLDVSDLKQLPSQLQQHDSAQQLRKLLEMLQAGGVTNARFDMSLMRGFDYYTDIVFEVNDTHPENNRSMLGGGRYDGLVGLFGVEPVPTVGFGWGDVTLQNFLELHRLLPPLPPETDLFVATIGDVFSEVQKVIAELRSHGLNVAVGAPGKKLGDHFKTAEKKGIAWVLVIGENELRNQQYTLKNLQTGEEEKRALERIVTIIRDYQRA